MSSGPQSQEAALADLEALIADFQASGMRELHVRAGDVEIYLSTDACAPGLGAQAVAVRVEPTALSPAGSAPTATSVVPSSAPAAARSSALPDGAVIVTAPYLGTFYRAPKPGSPVYVDVGSTVTEETEMCLVEVMKLFTAVRAGVSGTVHAILATDGAMVEADQPLFAVMPG